jgi:hypothetical protein
MMTTKNHFAKRLRKEVTVFLRNMQPTKTVRANFAERSKKH